MCYVTQHAVVRYCSSMLRAAIWRGFISCIGHMCQSLRQAEFAYGRRQVLNRLMIPQGLSTLLFRRWSEVPTGGGVRGDSQ